MMTNSNPYTVLWVILFFIVFIWSGVNPKDYPTWALEVSPAIIGFIVLAITRKTFPLTSLSYVLILLHCWILFVGGHYTYADVPLFDAIQEAFNHSRNNYDKVGHFAQGFVPAIICREVIIRRKLINDRFFTHFFTICFCLALSAFYELIEWWVAVSTGDSAVAFLATQGYVWDTQSDMAWALFAAIGALLSLSHFHDKQINRLQIKMHE